MKKSVSICHTAWKWETTQHLLPSLRAVTLLIVSIILIPSGYPAIIEKKTAFIFHRKEGSFTVLVKILLAQKSLWNIKGLRAEVFHSVIMWQFSNTCEESWKGLMAFCENMRPSRAIILYVHQYVNWKIYFIAL